MAENSLSQPIDSSLTRFHILLWQATRYRVAPSEVWALLEDENLLQSSLDGQVYLTEKGNQYVEDVLMTLQIWEQHGRDTGLDNLANAPV